MNHALLMKVGWGLIGKRDSLWAQTLRHKYRCGGDIIPIVNCRNRNSNLWQGVCKFWSKVLEGTTWKLGNGKRVSFWNDKWLNKGLLLRDVAKRDLSDDDKKDTVYDFTRPNGEWNLDKLQHYLPMEICNDFENQSAQQWKCSWLNCLESPQGNRLLN